MGDAHIEAMWREFCDNCLAELNLTPNFLELFRMTFFSGAKVTMTLTEQALDMSSGEAAALLNNLRMELDDFEANMILFSN